MYPRGEKRFQLINLITIVALFVLILAGGVVRSSGSGMGCPDWPKCFGSVIPPTSASQLPEGYEDKYVEQRVAKNMKFARTLAIFGFSELADRVRNDKSVLLPEEFNVAKTWTEYINRLIGAVTGLFLLACVFFSSTYLKSRKRIFFLSLANVILVGFQAWLGSIVVSTNLLAWVVTIHMLLALLIVAISIYTYFQARLIRDNSLLSGSSAQPLGLISIVVLAIMIVQITIGTEVREQIDYIAASMNLDRSGWVPMVGFDFNFHRDLAFLIVILSGVLFFLITRVHTLNIRQVRVSKLVLFLVVLQGVTGYILSAFSLPPVAQTMHLVLASLMFSAQFYLVLLLISKNNYTVAA